MNKLIFQQPNPTIKHGLGVFVFYIGLWIVLFSPAVYADITDGLTGHWAFDETSGTIAADSCLNDNPSCTPHNGTLQNGVAWNSQGVMGGAAEFSEATRAKTHTGDPIGSGPDKENQ